MPHFNGQAFLNLKLIRMGKKQSTEVQSKPKNENKKFNFTEAAVVIALVTALVYVCDWLFEFFSCISLAIPINLVRASPDQLPPFAMIIFTFSVLIFIADFIIRLYPYWAYVSLGLFFIILPNGVDYYLNKEFITLNINLYIIGISISLIVIRFILSKLWDKDFRKKMLYSIFTEDTDFSKPFGENFPAIGKQIRFTVFIAFCLITFSSFTGYMYPKIFPPCYRIKGNNELVLLKKYGDTFICGETQTNNDTLTRSIKILKSRK